MPTQSYHFLAQLPGVHMGIAYLGALGSSRVALSPVTKNYFNSQEVSRWLLPQRNRNCDEMAGLAEPY